MITGELREKITLQRGKEGEKRRSQEGMDIIAGTCPRRVCLVSRGVKKGLGTQCRHGGVQISGDLGKQSEEAPGLPAPLPPGFIP